MADPATAMITTQVVGGVAKGLQGNAQAMNEAARADAQAALAETQALQRDTQARDELERFLSSVQAARAANGLSSRSPNALVLEQDARRQSTSERLRNRADDRQRAANFRAAGQGYRRQGRMSLVTGAVSGGIPLAQGAINGVF